MRLTERLADDELVWMYEQLSHADRRKFWQIQEPVDRLRFLVMGGDREVSYAAA